MIITYIFTLFAKSLLWLLLCLDLVLTLRIWEKRKIYTPHSSKQSSNKHNKRQFISSKNVFNIFYFRELKIMHEKQEAKCKVNKFNLFSGKHNCKFKNKQLILKIKMAVLQSNTANSGFSKSK